MTAMRLHRYPSPSGGIALGKMGVGATMMSAAKTARDYVQDGLVAMWDGIENAGWGTHDPNATTWIELVSGSPCSASAGSISFENKCLLVPMDLRIPIANSAILETLNNKGTQVLNLNYTLEVVFETSGKMGMLGGYIIKSNAGTFQSFDFMTRNYSATNAPAFFYDRSSTSIVLGVQGSLYNTVQYAAVTRIINDTVGYYNDASSIALNTATFPNIGNSNSVRDMTIGGHYNANWQGFNGKIYRIAFYARALTADEIAANYAIDKERFNLP